MELLIAVKNHVPGGRRIPAYRWSRQGAPSSSNASGLDDRFHDHSGHPAIRVMATRLLPVSRYRGSATPLGKAIPPETDVCHQAESLLLSQLEATIPLTFFTAPGVHYNLPKVNVLIRGRKEENGRRLVVLSLRNINFY